MTCNVTLQFLPKKPVTHPRIERCAHAHATAVVRRIARHALAHVITVLFSGIRPFLALPAVFYAALRIAAITISLVPGVALLVKILYAIAACKQRHIILHSDLKAKHWAAEQTQDSIAKAAKGWR
jgi:hypothetical protein